VNQFFAASNRVMLLAAIFIATPDKLCMATAKVLWSLSVVEMSTSTEFILSEAEGLSDQKYPNHLGDCYIILN
jgi:hypothetical protein